MAAIRKKILREIDYPSSSNISHMELVSAAAFKFRKPSASLHDSKEFLDSVFKSLKRLEDLNFSQVSKFTLDFPFHQQLGTSSVASLIHQALQFKIEKLKLILTNGDLNECLSDSDVNRSFDLFRLPGFLNNNILLTKMDLAMCSFNEVREPIKWNYLTELKLAHTCLNRIDTIVAGCPSLDTLELFHCWGFKTLNFEKLQNLTVFVLDGVWPKKEEQFDSITISVPSVEFLGISGSLDLRYVVLKNISGCLDANIDFHWTSGDHGKNLENGGFNTLNLQRFLNSLRHVPVITFGTWFIETISRKIYVGFELQECIELTLQAPVLDRYQRGILHIIDCCSKVETVTIRATRTHPPCKICPNGICIHDISKSTNEISPSSSSSSSSSSCNYQRSFGFKILKYCKDEKAAKSKNEAETRNNIGDLPVFVEFLIKNSRSLQKVVIK